MKILHIKIQGLFRTFSYDITMPEEQSPLVMTGLNGYGKTTILTIIKKLSEKDFYYFYILPFHSISLSFDNGCRMAIFSQEEESQATENDEEADCNLTHPRVVTFQWTSPDDEPYEFILDREKIASAARRYMRFRSYREQQDPNTDAFYQWTINNTDFYSNFEGKEAFNILSMMLDGLKVTFVTAQRLEPVEEKIVHSNYRYSTETVYKPKIREISQRIKDQLEKERLKYLNHSQLIDRKLIEDLLADLPVLCKEQYDELKKQVEDKVADLKSFGLIGNITIRPYDEHHNHILSVYLRNTNDKLSVYDKILSKLKLFSKIIGSLDLVNKTVSYNPSDGLSIKTSDGLFLDAAKLSSGEQNEIVMLYDMIFEVADGTILLIDEPEISLHVAWQNRFVDTLTEIAASKDVQVMIATHSPQIIGNRWDECYDLCEHVAQ